MQALKFNTPSLTGRKLRFRIDAACAVMFALYVCTYLSSKYDHTELIKRLAGSAMMLVSWEASWKHRNS
jgi:hypothetical protein